MSSGMWRGSAIGSALFLASTAFLAAASQHREAPIDQPCVTVWRHGGMQQKPNEGLLMAVWADGTILFSHRLDRLGELMLVGKAKQEDIRAMLAGIRAGGFWKERRNWVVPDSQYTTIAVRDRQATAAHSWHENLTPGFGGDINTDEQYRGFVRMWKKTIAAVAAVAPVEVHRLSDKVDKDGVFRGYVVREASKTPWRP